LKQGKILTSELDSEPQTWTWIHELILSKSIAILTDWGGLAIHIKTKSNYQKIQTSELDSEPQTWTWIHELILSKSIAFLTALTKSPKPYLRSFNDIHIKTKSKQQKY